MKKIASKGLAGILIAGSLFGCASSKIIRYEKMPNGERDRVTYDVKEVPTADGFVEGSIKYSFLNLAGFGLPLIVDIVESARGNKEDTIFYDSFRSGLTDSQKYHRIEKEVMREKVE
jgi:hypothetical protein